MMKMTIIETIKAAVALRFPNGEIFTCHDLGNLGFKTTQIRTALVRLTDDDYKFLKVERRMIRKNGSSLNQYRIAKVDYAEVDSNPGDATNWHRGNVLPVNKCGDNETYEVMLHGTDEIECYAWRGFWQIPQVYIKGWRGVTR